MRAKGLKRTVFVGILRPQAMTSPKSYYWSTLLGNERKINTKHISIFPTALAGQSCQRQTLIGTNGTKWRCYCGIQFLSQTSFFPWKLLAIQTITIASDKILHESGPRNSRWINFEILGVKNVADFWWQFSVKFPRKIGLKFVTENLTTLFTARKEICHLELTSELPRLNNTQQNTHDSQRHDRILRVLLHPEFRHIFCTFLDITDWETNLYPARVLGGIMLALWACQTPAQHWIKIVHPWVQIFYPVLGLGSGERLLWHFQTPVLYWINFSVCDWLGAQKLTQSGLYGVLERDFERQICLFWGL